MIEFNVVGRLKILAHRELVQIDIKIKFFAIRVILVKKMIIKF
jgi:hypothetical protein